MAWGKSERSPLCRHTGSLWTLQTHIYANTLASKHRLNCHSYQLSYILLICLIFDMKQLTVGGRDDGGGARGTEWALLSAACEWSYNMNTQRGKHCLSLCAPLVSFLSAPCLSLHPSLSSSTWHASGVSTRGGRGKTIMLGSHKSTGCNSQAIHY